MMEMYVGNAQTWRVMHLSCCVPVQSIDDLIVVDKPDALQTRAGLLMILRRLADVR